MRSPARAAARPALSHVAGAQFAVGRARLFTELTGYPLDVLAGPPAGLAWDVGVVTAVCRSRLRLAGRRALSRAACDRCASDAVQRALASPQRGYRFRGACGADAFLVPVEGRGGRSDLVALRAAPDPPARVGPALDDVRSTSPPPVRGPAPGFARAVRLLRLMVHDLRMTATARRGEAAASRARRAVEEHEHEEARLRRLLGRVVPEVRGSAARLQGERRAEQVVRRALESLRRGYARPLALRDVAAELRINPSYLSFLFSRTLGISFKTYLTLLRVQQAQELLLDPLRRVSEVAYAVGYATPDRFRAAFLAWTGLSPSRWRELLRVG